MQINHRHCRFYLFPIEAAAMLLLLLAQPSLAKGQQPRQQPPRNKFGVPITKFGIDKARNGPVLVTEFENWLPIFTRARKSYRQYTDQRWDAIYTSQRARGKTQEPLSNSTPFPCELEQPLRSAEPPQTVHRLRPGDVDIVAAMGDSLTAGSGILSETPIDVINEYRSMSFSAGGRSSWRTFLTLPNILRVYNPNLYGFATQDSTTLERASVFNVAELSAMSQDILYQARVLIKRLQRDPRVDMQRDWKVLTLFIGNNDICFDVCFYDDMENALRQHEKHLLRTLTELQQQVPRLYINLITTINPITSIYQIRNKPLECYLSHTIGCSCVFNAGITPAQRARFNAFIGRWQAIDERVAALPQFRTDDFVVNYHNFNISTDLLQRPNGDTDFSIFAVDCFHLSQRGHATVANALWNGMLRNSNQVDFLFEHFDCPSRERPYLLTWANNEGRG